MSQLRRLEVKHDKASTISPNKYNPNKQNPKDFELLIRSMAEDGFTQPIVVQAASREIVDGEHRWTGMIVISFLNKHWPLPEQGKGVIWPPELINEARLKRAQIIAGPVTIEAKGFEGTFEGIDPVIAYVPVEFSEAQRRISTLRHNRARGQEDLDLLSGVLADLETLGVGEWAKGALQLEDDEFEALLGSTAVSAAETFAGDAFKPSWEPDVVGSDIATQEEIQIVHKNKSDAPLAIAATANATKVMVVRNAALAAAPTAAARQEIVKAHAMFRLAAAFHGPDAALVSEVLGATPAERLVQLCRAADEAAQAQVAEN